MLWVQINAIALLIGFELNASIAVNRDQRQAIFDEKKMP
jgi:membrane protein